MQVEGSRNQGPSFGSPFEPYLGMSDEAEAKREEQAAVAALLASQGYGEVSDDDLHDDAVDLGFAPEGR